MNKKTIIVLTVIFVLVLVAASLLYQILITANAPDQMMVEETHQEGAVSGDAAETRQPAPDFTVTDKDGNLVNLSDFRGKPTIVNFWASWCGPCQMEMPDFQKAYEEYGDEINFLMVNLTDGARETVDSAKEFIESKGYSFPVYFDTENSNAAMTYGTYSIPVTYFLDSEGNGIVQGSGALSAEALQKGIDMIYPE